MAIKTYPYLPKEKERKVSFECFNCFRTYVFNCWTFFKVNSTSIKRNENKLAVDVLSVCHMADNHSFSFAHRPTNTNENRRDENKKENKYTRSLMVCVLAPHRAYIYQFMLRHSRSVQLARSMLKVINKKHSVDVCVENRQRQLHSGNWAEEDRTMAWCTLRKRHTCTPHTCEKKTQDTMKKKAFKQHQPANHTLTFAFFLLLCSAA